MGIPTIGGYKYYSRVLDEKYSPIVVEAIVSFLSQNGYQLDVAIAKQPNMFGDWDAEIVGFDGSKVELEYEAREDIDFCKRINRGKENKEWRYATMRDLHFPLRKATSKADFFVSYSIFNDMLAFVDCCDVLRRENILPGKTYVPAKDVNGNVVKEADGKVKMVQEWYLSVGWEKPFFYKRKDGIWQASGLGMSGLVLRPRHGEWINSPRREEFESYYKAMSF